MYWAPTLKWGWLNSNFGILSYPPNSGVSRVNLSEESTLRLGEYTMVRRVQQLPFYLIVTLYS